MPSRMIPGDSTCFLGRCLRKYYTPDVKATDMEVIWIGIGGLLLGITIVLAMYWRRSGDARQSRKAHEAAQNREPPVSIGETYEFGVTEFTDHHSGEKIAVGKVEGFVIFTEDIPSSVDVGDVIRARVMSFNEGKTSADAVFVDTV